MPDEYLTFLASSNFPALFLLFLLQDLNRIEPWAFTGPFKHLPVLGFEPLWCNLCPESQVSSKIALYLPLSFFPTDLTSFLVPAETPCYHHHALLHADGVWYWYLPNIVVRIFKFCLISPDESPTWFWQNPNWLFMGF